MNINNSNQDPNKMLFVHLVTMLSISAMQQMGKIINPATGKTEISLDGAQATIDMLDMLSTKTKGNLDADEGKLLKDTLATLKMNFVETKELEAKKPKEQFSSPEPQRPARRSQERSEGEGGSEVNLSAEAPAKAEDQQDTKPADSKAQGTGHDKTETKDPKFHKSYE